MSIDWKSDQGMTLTLLDAQRGLTAAHNHLTSAIEELNSPASGDPDRDSRVETALVQMAKAIEFNVDFLRQTRGAASNALKRLAEREQQISVEVKQS
ncbi:MAG: hypothetical protein GYB49_09355 [Alphaproteobacteria bacterium]|nr:hypothetical protein [Alphaproteobacteria bacterium]